MAHVAASDAYFGGGIVSILDDRPLPARGSRLLFGILVATILIPPTVAIVPQFILFSRLGWVGTYLPLIVPSLFGNAFAIFLFRQWFRNLPPNLFESAELEGANPFQAFRHIGLPLARPIVAAVAVFAFVGSWNELMGVIKSKSEALEKTS
jgi:multiple sugar transport system permease protein